MFRIRFVSTNAEFDTFSEALAQEAASSRGGVTLSASVAENDWSPMEGYLEKFGDGVEVQSTGVHVTVLAASVKSLWEVWNAVIMAIMEDRARKRTGRY